jgi:hypothetical protein
MKRRLFGAIALGCLFVSVAIPVAEGDPSRSAPMQFVLRQDGGANCAPKCRTWISATGMIRAETARDFETFAAKSNLRGATIALNSEGGSVHGAIALGRLIRKFDMTTTVGRTIDGPGAGEAAAARNASLSPRADCESMCVFVLLSGARRIVPNEARVRVHQIWLGDRRDDAAAATYSAEDLVLVQRDIGKLAQYTIEMGGTVELLEVSLRIPPWEPMRALTRDELRRMNLDNSEVANLRPAAPEAVTTAAPSSLPAKRIAMTAGQRDREKERAWTMAERAGNTTLTRRHPLTFEGEEIGSIEVSFACGAAPNEFQLLYDETRRAAEGEAPKSLKSVEVRLGGKTLALKVGAARDGSSSGERQYSASGALAASVLKNFASSASRSLTVETVLDHAEPITIRIGNTNAFGNLPVFLNSCSQPGRSEQAHLQPGQ